MNTILYAHHGKNHEGCSYWTHITTEPRITALYGSQPIFQLICIPADADHPAEIFGWLRTTGQLSLLYNSPILRGMCFAYGMQVEIDRGHGTPVEFAIVAVDPEVT